MAFRRALAAPALAGLLADWARRQRAEGTRREVRAETSAGEGATRVAFLGNSFLYFNDVPRLFQALCVEHGEEVRIRDCLRGGSSWGSLLREGNGMGDKFRTPPALLPDGSHDVGAPTVEALLAERGGWDFVVMNTYSQEAAQPPRRKQGIAALQQLAPLLDKARACPVLLVTPAYRAPAKGSESIGDWGDFTWSQSEGFREYAEHLGKLCPAGRQPRTADANRAFALVHGERPELWRELFHTDDFHPSAVGSFLEACVLFCAVFGQAPPLPGRVLAEPALLFARARRLLPPPDVGRMPTAEELVYLRGAALRSFGSDALGGVRLRL